MARLYRNMLEMLQHAALNNSVHLFGVTNGVLWLKTEVRGLDILSTDFIPPCRRNEVHYLFLLERITTQNVTSLRIGCVPDYLPYTQSVPHCDARRADVQQDKSMSMSSEPSARTRTQDTAVGRQVCQGVPVWRPLPATDIRRKPAPRIVTWLSAK